MRRAALALVAITFITVQSLAIAPWAHALGGHGCDHCAPLHVVENAHAHIGHDHAADHDHAVPEHDGPQPPDSGADDADDCPLCRVLATVPAHAALPPVLPIPHAVPALLAGVSPSYVPAVVLALSLARGPPTPTRR